MYLQEVQRKAYTRALRDGCKEALEALDIEKKISQEMDGCGKELESLRRELEEVNNTLGALGEEVDAPCLQDTHDTLGIWMH